MSVKCQVVMDIMERIAPRCLAESWDNVGLLVGSPAQTINNIMVCLDINEALIDRAVEQNIDMIISHHPVIFQPVKNLRTDLPHGKLLAKLLQNDISVFAAHTNLDSAAGGVNDVLATKLGIKNLRPLSESYREALVKLVVFVPEEHAETLQAAIGDAGAGYIGGYSHCSFSLAGQGRFKPLAGAKPFVGKINELAKVNEVRIETIVPEKLVRKVVKAMLAAHPYEEVAYDLYPLKNNGQTFGLGRIGTIEAAMSIENFVKQVQYSLPSQHIRFVKSSDRQVKKVAVCSGSGADFIVKASYSGADVLVTGDLKYHEAQKAQEYGIHVVDAGHFGTEVIIVDTLMKKIENIAKEKRVKVNIIADKVTQDPFSVI